MSKVVASRVSTLPLHFCVVGSGPAGMYSTESILQTFKNSKVDVIERLPAPFGLVRYGVAPDHPETKNVLHKFDEILAQKQRVRYFGNVRVGTSLPLSLLRQHYDGVIIASGCEGDKDLGVKGERDMQGVYSAKDFVAWYNGHPDFRNARFLLDSEDAFVIGHGNVALDVARLLLKSPSSLAHTDITSYAFSALSASKVKRVHVIGRRGLAQASFTTAEVREMLTLDGVECFSLRKRDVDIAQLSETSQQELKASRGHRRMTELLSQKTRHIDSVEEVERGGEKKQLFFHFLLSPRQFISSSSLPSPTLSSSSSFSATSSSSRLSSVVFERNSLQGPPGLQRAILTGESIELRGGTLFRSVGYSSEAPWGIPFDPQRSIIPNINGRVLFTSTPPVPASSLASNSGSSSSLSSLIDGVYVSGWIKRGPSGIIGTNKWDAEETVASLAEDVETGRLNPVRAQKGLEHIQGYASLNPITYTQWKAIDAEEVKRGERLGKPREKITDVNEMIEIARNVT